MAGTSDDSSTPDEPFCLLADEYEFTVERVRDGKLAETLARRFLEEGERADDGRKRYKIWEIEAFPGGLAPSPYDGAFWRSDPARGIHCEINYQGSSARWTGPASAEWTAFDGRRTASYDLRMIRLNHDLFVEFLQSAGVPDLPPLQPLSAMEPAEVSAAESTTVSTPAPAAESAAPKEPQGRQADRVKRALREMYPPEGKVPDDKSIPILEGEIADYLGPESRNRGLADPSRKVVTAVINWRRRIAG
jgi:hypothetical protein